MFLASVLNHFCGLVDSLIYTAIVLPISYLNYPIGSRILRLLFTIETYGSQEKGKCVFLTNHVHRVSTRLLFSSPTQYLTDDPAKAVELANELGIPIQTIVSYHTREYFNGKWVIPRPYALVYEYGEVGVKTTQEYLQYFLDKHSTRPSVRLYDPEFDQTRLIILALLCSRWPVTSLYLLMRYQWYNRVCFEWLLIMMIVVSFCMAS